eukprot:6624020-Prymnesium_polylepis.1
MDVPPARARTLSDRPNPDPCGCASETPTAAQQQDEGRGWSWGRDPEPVHPARCGAGEPQGDTGDTEAAAGMGSTPAMAAWHGTRSQLRRGRSGKSKGNWQRGR